MTRGGEGADICFQYHQSYIMLLSKTMQTENMQNAITVNYSVFFSLYSHIFCNHSLTRIATVDTIWITL